MCPVIHSIINYNTFLKDLILLMVYTDLNIHNLIISTLKIYCHMKLFLKVHVIMWMSDNT